MQQKWLFNYFNMQYGPDRLCIFSATLISLSSFILHDEISHSLPGTSYDRFFLSINSKFGKQQVVSRHPINSDQNMTDKRDAARSIDSYHGRSTSSGKKSRLSNSRSGSILRRASAITCDICRSLAQSIYTCI